VPATTCTDGRPEYTPHPLRASTPDPPMFDQVVPSYTPIENVPPVGRFPLAPRLPAPKIIFPSLTRRDQTDAVNPFVVGSCQYPVMVPTAETGRTTATVPSRAATASTRTSLDLTGPSRFPTSSSRYGP
jgi:hypothetical protein